MHWKKLMSCNFTIWVCEWSLEAMYFAVIVLGLMFMLYLTVGFKLIHNHKFTNNLKPFTQPQSIHGPKSTEIVINDLTVYA